jgi:MFS family permease
MKPAHWCLIGSLYVTQFLPVSFFFMGLPAILRSEGKSLEQIGVLYLLGFVWVLKIFWAPLVDRFSFGRLGHYRGWLLTMQTAMIAVLLVIGQMDGLANFTMLVCLSLLLTVFSATQDIATDAITCRLLSPQQRGLGNSLQVAGGLVGIVLGGGVTLSLYNSIGWSGCFLLMAAVLTVTLIQVFFFKEPQLADADGATARPGYSRIWTVWRRPGMGRWALLMLTVPIGISMVFAMLTPMLVDIGWSIERVGFTLNVAGSLIGMVAVFVTGWLIQRVGRRRMLIAAAFIQAAVILALLPLAQGATTDALVVPALLLTFLIYNPIATIMLTMMMDRAGKGSEGTDFTAQYSLYSFMGFLSGAIALQVAGAAGYTAMMLIAALLALTAGVLAISLYREPGIAGDANVSLEEARLSYR